MRRFAQIAAVLLLVGACGRSPVAPPQPDLKASDTYLRFSAESGDVVAPQMITVGAADDTSVEWKAILDAAWLQVEPRRGLGPTPVRVGVRTTRVPPGLHTATVRFDVVSGPPDALGTAVTVELNLDAPGWTALDGPYGGDVRRIVVDPDDVMRVVAFTDGREVMVSNDGGASFLEHVDLAGSGIKDFEMATGGRAYAAFEDEGVWRSDDGGLSWMPTALGALNIQSIAINRSDSNHVLAELDRGWVTTDGGLTWNETITDDPYFSVSSTPSIAEPFLYGTADGRLVATGGSVTRTVATFAGLRVQGFVETADGSWYVSLFDDVSNHPQIQKSSDGGATWTRVRQGLPDEDFEHFSYTLTADGNTLWAGSNRGLYRTRDGGVLFERVTFAERQGGATDDDLYQVAPHPDGPLVPHRWEGVLRMVEGQGLVRMAIMDHGVSGLDFHPATGVLVAATSASTVSRWTNAVGFEGLGGSGFSTYSPRNLLVDPRNPDVLLISTWGDYVQRTLDGGQNWAEIRTGIPDEYIDAIARAPDDPDVIWMADGSGMFRSSDGGLSYALVDDTISCSRLAAVSATVAICGHSNDGAHRVTLTGTTAITSLTADILFTSRTADGAAWYYLENRALFRSRDDGVTWTELWTTDQSPSAILVDPARPQMIFVASAGELWVSRDDGATWTAQGAPFSASRLALDPSGGALWVGTGDGGVYRWVDPGP